MLELRRALETNVRMTVGDKNVPSYIKHCMKNMPGRQHALYRESCEPRVDGKQPPSRYLSARWPVLSLFDQNTAKWVALCPLPKVAIAEGTLEFACLRNLRRHPLYYEETMHLSAGRAAVVEERREPKPGRIDGVWSALIGLCYG